MPNPSDYPAVVQIGDKIQIGTMLTTGEMFWGSIQTVKWIGSDGSLYFRARHGKVDKVAHNWRLPQAGVETTNSK